MRRISQILFWLGVCIVPLVAEEVSDGHDFLVLGTAYRERVLPLVERFCLDCHDAETKKGELDLERFATLEAVRQDHGVWQAVAEQVTLGEMPPKDKTQPSVEEREELLDWIERYLDAEALAGAGDPGPVVLRRLSNAEYTYTVHDLTHVSTLRPTREFPVDSAAGEGFTNTGSSLSMSPALFEKYLDAGKAIASHAVLLPDGFRFSPHTSRPDWSNAIVEEIRTFYREALQAGFIDFGYRSQVGTVDPKDSSEGRLDEAPYFEALIKYREVLLGEPGAAASLAREENLNPKYFALLARELLAEPDPGSVLINQWRSRWRAAAIGDGEALAQWVRRWKDGLWEFNPVGHLGGYVFDWQENLDPVSTQAALRLKLESGSAPNDLEAHVTVSLTAGTAGDGAVGDVVRWRHPRLVRPGKSPLHLGDVPWVWDGFLNFRQALFSQTSELLRAAFEAKPAGKVVSVQAVAAAHGLDSALLRPVLEYLGIPTSTGVAIQEYLTLPKQRVANQEAISGWGLEGQGDLSLLGNRSDATWRIPGEVPPHGIVVHPMPRRWIAAGWMSPIEGPVTIEAHVQDRHSCGNGVRWILQHRRGNREQVLRTGVVDPGQMAPIESLDEFKVSSGDLVSIVIDARDGNHACDLTEIELRLTEIGGSERHWSLGEDCADSILEGNPHADQHGHLEVWHFYTGTDEQATDPSSAIPEDSILAQWLKAENATVAGELGQRLEEFLTEGLPENVSVADRRLVETMRDPTGPLFARVDQAAFMVFASDPRPELPEDWGIDPALFDEEGNLVVSAPSSLPFRLPAALVDGAEFVVTGQLDGDGGSVQLGLSSGSSEPSEELVPGVPVVVSPGSLAEKHVLRSFADFRDLFPAAMCYARVVPIDEVVTLILYHREDEHLARLMLDEDEKRRLDRLWDELAYVSHDAFRIEVALEQILEFATQDADPRKFAPMLEPVAAGAKAFRHRLRATEPGHVDALLAFAARAYRRPLTPEEEHGLRAFYHSLRQEALDHEAAFRLTLARIFAAPAFLYRAEEPVSGVKQGPVSPWEQATRLSYFLWASTPDAELTAAAASGNLNQPDVIAAQARRLLGDARTRRLAIEFACQWLHLRDFDQFDEKNERLYPEFAGLRGAMYEEAIRFFTDLMQNNGSILSILEADHTFVNADLRAFYGLPEKPSSTTETWYRVESLRSHGRGGILGMAATLAKPSGASRTSPILRGNWVAETLLGERLPDPPAGVPQLPEAVPQGLSERAMIERHSSDPACAKCHDRIDPYGFALESFDTIGRARNDKALDTRTRLPDGTEIEGLAGLRQYLVGDRREAFVRQFCRKLLGYALGRGVSLSDRPLLDEMMIKLEASDYRFHTAVECIVRSRQFREIRGR